MSSETSHHYVMKVYNAAYKQHAQLFSVIRCPGNEVATCMNVLVGELIRIHSYEHMHDVQ